MDFVGLLSMIIYEVLYIWCLRYNISSAWILDIRTSTCFSLNLFSLHTLAWACILQFNLSIMLVSLISQPCLHIATESMQLFILCIIDKLKNLKANLLHKFTTEYT